jgi:hypothetical protein
MKYKGYNWDREQYKGEGFQFNVFWIMIERRPAVGYPFRRDSFRNNKSNDGAQGNDTEKKHNSLKERGFEVFEKAI